MCGFAGVVAWDEKYRVSRDTLERMSARIAHRGPDGQGLYLNHEEGITPERPQVGLVHRRLAILDLDPRANQPFTDNQGRWIVFNGEIYNFRELRAELTKLKPDYAWRTSGDTEVLLLAYDAWDEKCVEHLNGMFAFAVWDEPEGRLFLARDRMGQKPLYCALRADEPRDPLVDDYGRPRAIAFASEIGALWPIAWAGHELQDSAVREYLAVGYISCPSTIYQGISKLAPSNRMTIRGTEISHSRYFDPNASSGGVSDGDARCQTRQLLLSAISRQMIADVPLGCFLSGGVDSSAVAAGMKAAAHGGEVLTFSIGFDDRRYDETPYASAVARHLGTRHLEFRVAPDAASDLPALAAVFGEPFGDSSALPTHYLSRETRKHVKVALSGDGGDELFAGYDRYRAMRISESLPFAARVATRTAAAVVPGAHPKGIGTRLRRFAAGINLDAAKRYSSYVRLFSRALANELFKGPDPQSDDVEIAFEGLVKSVGGRDAVRAAMAYDRKLYLPDDLLDQGRSSVDASCLGSPQPLHGPRTRAICGGSHDGSAPQRRLEAHASRSLCPGPAGVGVQAEEDGVCRADWRMVPRRAAGDAAR